MLTGRTCFRFRRSRCKLGWRNRVRLGRDYYVWLDSNDYSVHLAGTHTTVELTELFGVTRPTIHRVIKRAGDTTV